MTSRVLARALVPRALTAPATQRSLHLVPAVAGLAFAPWAAAPYSTRAPSTFDPAFWRSLIPKPFRGSAAAAKKPRSKSWNPATFFIWIFLLIGSMSIQMIALRHEFAAFSRRADARIGLLKEVIEKVQRGEQVDVEGLLGVGDKEQEEEWEQVLKEIERENQLLEEKSSQAPAASPAPAAAPAAAPATEARRVKSNAPSGFY